MFSKRTVVGLICGFLIGGYAIPIVVAEEAGSNSNLVINGGFEELTDGWNIKGYPADKELTAPLLKGIFSTTEKAHSGKGALKIDVLEMHTEILDTYDNASVVWEQEIKHPSISTLCGKKVRFTAWVYFESIGEKGPVFHPGPSFVVHFKDKNNLLMEDKALIVRADPKILALLGYNTYQERVGKWIKIQMEGVVPEETYGLETFGSMVVKDDLEINTTCVYIDDISLEVIEGKEL